MKNYITVFCVPITTSFFAQKNIGAVTPEQAQALADQYLASDPGSTQDGPPTRFYWLLNKRVVSELFVSQTDAFDPFNNPQFTQDTEVAKKFGIQTELPNLGAWGGTDDSDPKQVKAAEAAETAIKAPASIKFNLAGASNLYNNFLKVMNNLIAFYQKKKDARTVGVLQFLLKQFLEGKLSITEILLQLKEQFIVP
jgi:hypothetical protein